jgi:SpoVK/Ycf46/Vps4 family AAA+-type ATPase
MSEEESKENSGNSQNAQQLLEQNEALRRALELARSEVAGIREEVTKLKAPPLPYGIFIRQSENPELIVVAVDGRMMEVNLANDELDATKLLPGQRVLLNPAANVIELREADRTGVIGKVVDFLPDDRLIVNASDMDQQVMIPSAAIAAAKMRVGDKVRFDPASNVVFEKLPKSEVEEVVLEEIPDVTYDDIGGLDEQLEQIKDAIELPFIYGFLYRQFDLKPPKGILLYGPPGCGKTLVAKAVANSLSKRIHKTLRQLKEVLEMSILLKEKNASYWDIADRFEALRNDVYEYQSIYRNIQNDDEEAMYDKLDKSSLLGNYVRRRMEEDKGRLTPSVGEWYDLLIELKEKGYGVLTDRKRIGEMLESKSRKYLEALNEISDEDYAGNWLADFLANNGIDPDSDLKQELAYTEEKLGGGFESYFLNIKGPELLNKYVGETEHKIREVFMKAREKAERGLPVIVFFDEMESIFRTRGSGISSDVESTIVPQFLAEIDGVEKLDNVITIGASNRQDLIDPAVLRPGRLDVKIRIDRPNQDAAREIFAKYLKTNVPLHKTLLEQHEGDKEKALTFLIESAVEEMYTKKDENQFLRVTYRNGDFEILYFKDFSSGAMIEGIISRAKTYAIKRTILCGDRGLKLNDLINAIRDEYKENEDLPNTTNPDDWAKISGKKGEMIIAIETLLPEERRGPAKEDEPDEMSVSSRYL